MTDQQKKFEKFSVLHRPGNPLVLFNVWDAGSAIAVQKAGAQAIATGSYSVAQANGFEDGETFPLDMVVANAARIVASVDVPVSIDFVRGYGDSAAHAGASLRALLGSGIVGVNIEDGLLDKSGMTSIDEQAERLASLSAARTQAGDRAWINARTDVFLLTSREAHKDHLPEALERGAAYAEAGAHSFFIPGLDDLDLIAKVCEASALAVNVMATGKAPTMAQFAAVGVGRISYGGYPWRRMMKGLETDAAAVFASS